MKIVVTNKQDFTDEQKRRLETLGEVTYYDSIPASGEEFLERVKGADIVCAGTAGLKDAYPQLKDVYVTVSFVSVAFIEDLDILKTNNVILSNAPGANRFAVSEWIMSMATLMMRDLYEAINREQTYRVDGALPPITPGLAGKKITILGYGNIGKQVGKLAEAYGMNVTHFKRGDNLLEVVKDADIVADTLSSNPTTKKLLNASMFDAMRQGSYFVSVTRSENLDEDAMLAALDSGKLVRAALDCGGILVGDTEDPYYQKLLKNPKVLVTPHISYNTEMTQQTGNNIMIDNVEAFIAGRPQNVVNS